MAKAITVKLFNVRGSFLQLFVPGKNEQGEDMGYGGDFIFPETHPQVGEINNAIMEAGQDFWKDKWLSEVLPEIKGKDRLCLHRGEVTRPGKQEYRGQLFVKATNSSKPNVFDQNNKSLTQADQKLFSGDFVDIIIDIKGSQHPKGGRRIRAEVTAVRKRSDGPRLSGGRVAGPEEFGAPVSGAGADSPAPGASASSLV
jgi:hypothetical protein